MNKTQKIHKTLSPITITIHTVFHTIQHEFLEKENLGKFLIRNFWRVKLWEIPACLLYSFMSQDIDKSLTTKFGNLPVIHRSFPLPKISVFCLLVLPNINVSQVLCVGTSKGKAGMIRGMRCALGK